MMKPQHDKALTFAANHFSFSFVLSLVWLACVWGQGLSDTYNDDPVWLKILIGILWILQTPAAVVEMMARRSSPFGASFVLLIFIAVIWSIVLGYIFDWTKRKFGGT